MAYGDITKRKRTEVMVTIFTTKTNLEDICLNPSKKAWYDMILKLRSVYVNEDTAYLDEDDPLFILDTMEVSINSKVEYINSIQSSPSIVLEEPCGIFLLDISKLEAERIQEQYGVVCQSISSMNHDVLTHKGDSVETIEKEKGKTWIDLFSKFKSTPSNSAIIIDAYLFANDAYDNVAGCYDSKRNVGLKNLERILDCILPKSFNSEYHIAVLLTNFDEAKNRSRTSLTNANIASAINKLKKSLKRSYEICIEVHFFSSKDEYHHLIHNRRIISNYYYVDALYKLAAFNDDGKANESQTITIKPLFELIHQDSESDMKEKRMRHDLKELHEYLQGQCTNPTSELYQNGRKCDSFSQVRHRLLK